jgi:hypothetical protein
LAGELLRTRATLPHARGPFDRWGELVVDDRGVSIESWRVGWESLDSYSVSDDVDVEPPYYSAVTVVAGGERVRFIVEPAAGQRFDALLAARGVSRFRSARTERKEWLYAAVFLVVIIVIGVVLTRVL